MNLLQLEHVSRIYGEKVLFDRISLQVNQGQKIGLVARNGSGKTTLLRVAAGLELPEGEGASVWMQKGLRLQYLAQEPDLQDEHSIIEAVLDSDDPRIRAVRAYEEALLLNRSPEEVQATALKMDDLKAWDLEAQIMEVLDKLRVGQLQKPVGQLSGGERKRLALAKMIIEDGALLILDEPTNHLDLDMIEWLEEYLSRPGLSLLMVTHDRYFLERVCDFIFELEGGQLYRYSGNYSDYLEKKAIREENEQIGREKDRKLLRKELEWVRRMPKARGTKAKSRVDAAARLEERVRGTRTDGALQIDLKGRRLGKKVLEAHNISKSFEGKDLIKSFSYKFRKGERVGIIGPNGSGKTTFLRMLTGGLSPDTGKVVIGDNTLFGHYTQMGLLRSDDKRVIETVREVAEFIPLEKGQKLTAEQLLERFLFDRKQQQVRVGQLSGGEKRRLYLLTILMTNPNFLILDEPTNDLDVLTLNVLEEFLQEFPGCVLIVTHDRYFMDKIVDHLFVFEGEGQIRDFPGNYTQYREVRTAERRAEQRTSVPADKPPATRQEQKGGLSRDQQKELKKLEREIKKLEERKAHIHTRFLEGVEGSGEVEKLSRELKSIEAEIESREERWMDLVEMA